MMIRFLSGLKQTGYLCLTGITAGIVAHLLTKSIHLIQSVSFGFTQGSFSAMISQVSPQRRVISLLLAGLIAGFGWRLLALKGKPLQTIRQTIHSQNQFSPWSQFFHGWIQLITVSMGAPVGREGASREVAVAMTSLWTKPLNIAQAEQSLLLACASGAALGAVYNAPLATILFILEAILQKWSFKNAFAAILTSVIAVEVVAFLSGHHDIQYLMPQQYWGITTLVWAALAGLLLALLAYGYKYLLTRLPKPNPQKSSFVRNVFLAFVAAAVLSIYFPEIMGNGKAGLLFVFHQNNQFSYIALLLLAKAIAVYLVFASGAKGGKIAPSMMLGGASAFLIATVSNALFDLNLPIPLAIMVGSALFLGIVNSMPLTAPIFLVEITGQSLSTVIPIAIASLVAYLAPKIYRQAIKRVKLY